MTDETTAVDRFDNESPQTTPTLEGWEATGDTADLGEPDAPVGFTEPEYTEPAFTEPGDVEPVELEAPEGSTESDYTENAEEVNPEWVEEKTEQVEESVEHADEAYKLEATPEGSFEDVKEDLDDRVALAAAPHREITTYEFQTTDELVQVEVGPDNNGDGTAEDLPQERLVKELAEGGQLFEKGGPLPNGELSDGVDGLFLAERSKQTGEKLF
jgi:hypothetical protein